VFLTITPDGSALPCHTAKMIKGATFPNVRDMSVDEIWNRSPGFNLFRGFEWMKDPCRSCPEKEKDLGGCRCQAFMLTGDAANADPVCSKSAEHARIEQAVAYAQVPDAQRVNVQPLVFRDPKNSRELAGRNVGPESVLR
jgi:pyrroloquinoline quinone biosynthesis protein E